MGATEQDQKRFLQEIQFLKERTRDFKNGFVEFIELLIVKLIN